jgi:flavin reductase (DIM6/NTAB) family NADH-FMN oxidoreductase RutF
MAIDNDLFLNVMGKFASGVTVITSEDEGSVCGLTANSFTSVSVEPPLVLFCADLDSRTCMQLSRHGTGFTVNILGEDQQQLSNKFANPELTIEERLEGETYRSAETGGPIFEDSPAWLECELEDKHESGDHIIYIGKVLRGDVRGEMKPLLYYEGQYGTFSSDD